MPLFLMLVTAVCGLFLTGIHLELLVKVRQAPGSEPYFKITLKKEPLVLRPSQFHKKNKNNTQGGDKHCEAIDFK